MSFWSSIGNFFSGIRDWFASPQTTIAIGNIEHCAEAVVCTIASGAQLAGSIESALVAGQSTQGTNLKLYTSTSMVCQAMGGTVVGTAANVPAVTSASKS